MCMGAQFASVPRKEDMKKLIGFAVFAAAVGALAWPKLAPLWLDEPSSEPQRRGFSPAVQTMRLEPQTFESAVTFNGTLVADKSIDIKSELRGKIEKINFTDGQNVRTGDLIAVIESGEVEAELRSLSEQLTLATLNAERLQSLYERGGITTSERDDAVSRREVLKAEVARLQIRLDKSSIVAPFDGTLGLRQVSLGDLIEPDTLITTLQTVTDLKVDFSVPERYRALLDTETRVSLWVAGYDQPFSGSVRAIDPRIDPATRTLIVRADVANPERKLLPGNYARVELVSRNDAALLVPSVAVLQSLESVSVFTVKDGVAVRKVVETGQRSSTQVEILRGLEPGEEVITSGIQSVRDGQTVNVRNASGGVG
jgi:membrane fusion protein, multidrug efflux system